MRAGGQERNPEPHLSSAKSIPSSESRDGCESGERQDGEKLKGSKHSSNHCWALANKNKSVSSKASPVTHGPATSGAPLVLCFNLLLETLSLKSVVSPFKDQKPLIPLLSSINVIYLFFYFCGTLGRTQGLTHAR